MLNKFQRFCRTLHKQRIIQEKVPTEEMKMALGIEFYLGTLCLCLSWWNLRAIENDYEENESLSGPHF